MHLWQAQGETNISGGGVIETQTAIKDCRYNYSYGSEIYCACSSITHEGIDTENLE